MGRPDQHVRRRTWPLAGVAVAFVILLGIGLRTWEARPAPQARPVSTDPASWDLPRLGGGSDVRLADYRGTPVVVSFFASWCTACQDELPLMDSAAKRLRGRVQFVGVDAEETGDGAAMARRFGITWWPLAVDTGGAANSGLHDALGGIGMPITAFYDATGTVRFVAPAALTASELSADLQRYEDVSVPS